MSEPCIQVNARIRSRKRAKEDICRLLKNKSTSEEPNNNITCGEQPLNLCVRDSPPPVTSIRPVPGSSTRRRKKRSAIFVPPEKLSNEVCICKFKFVAGHQPRLQEKKVLSIDSGGNFKFFPEVHPPAPPDPPESPVLFQQQPCAPESPTAVAVKPIPDLIPIQTLSTMISPAPVLGPPESQPSVSLASNTPASSPLSAKVRKMSRRQRLEQTFREKGFLIQTQHVQATEGSVFCKFRQLKKFTRYLYRSWRNYLPEDGRSEKGPQDQSVPSNL